MEDGGERRGGVAEDCRTLAGIGRASLTLASHVVPRRGAVSASATLGRDDAGNDGG